LGKVGLGLGRLVGVVEKGRGSPIVRGQRNLPGAKEERCSEAKKGLVAGAGIVNLRCIYLGHLMKRETKSHGEDIQKIPSE